jgi:hypothetical protein
LEDFFIFTFEEYPWRLFAVLFVLAWVILIISQIAGSIFRSTEYEVEKIMQWLFKQLQNVLLYGLVGWTLLYIIKLLTKI